MQTQKPEFGCTLRNVFWGSHTSWIHEPDEYNRKAVLLSPTANEVLPTCPPAQYLSELVYYPTPCSLCLGHPNPCDLPQTHRHTPFSQSALPPLSSQLTLSPLSSHFTNASFSVRLLLMLCLKSNVSLPPTPSPLLTLLCFFFPIALIPIWCNFIFYLFIYFLNLVGCKFCLFTRK